MVHTFIVCKVFLLKRSWKLRQVLLASLYTGGNRLREVTYVS